MCFNTQNTLAGEKPVRDHICMPYFRHSDYSITFLLLQRLDIGRSGRFSCARCIHKPSSPKRTHSHQGSSGVLNTCKYTANSRISTFHCVCFFVRIKKLQCCDLFTHPEQQPLQLQSIHLLFLQEDPIACHVLSSSS